MRRQSSLGQIMRRIRDAEIERCTGRILPFGSIWQWEKPAVVTGEYLLAHDHDGRDAYCAKGASVVCPNEDLWKSADLVPGQKGGYWVPLKNCHCCPFYRKGGLDHIRYPHCSWAMSERGGMAGALESVVKSISTALQKASEALK
jgi:hypothetical protein